jgi:hypothetical protein
MWQSRKTLIIAGALVIFALGGAALVYSGRQAGDAENSRVPDLLSALPAGAPAVVYIDLAAIRASAFYQQRQNRGPIAMPNQEYADFVQSTGFDFEKDLDRAAIASWPAGLAQGQDQSGKPKMIVVADGRFDQRKIRDYAVRKGKVDHQLGREVLLFSTDNPAKWNSIVFLNDHRIAIVEGPSIAALVEHHEDPPGTDPVRERAARVSGAAVFAISRVPQPPDKTPAAGAQSGPQSTQQATQLMNLAKSVQWVTLAARPEGSNVRISLEGECVSDTDARQLQATLEVFRSIARAGIENPKTQQSMNPAMYDVLETVLKTADITASAERVRILVELTPDILKLSEPRKQEQPSPPMHAN